MPTTRASSAAPEAGALPIPTESQRSILVQNVAGQPGTGRVGLDASAPADGVDLAARRCSRETATRCWHWRLCRPGVGSRIVFLDVVHEDIRVSKGRGSAVFPTEGVDLAAYRCCRVIEMPSRHRRLCRPGGGSRIVFLNDI